MNLEQHQQHQALTLAIPVQTISRSRRYTAIVCCTFAAVFSPLCLNAQPWDKLIDIQQVSVSRNCQEWEAPLESDCGSNAGVGLELGYAIRSLYEWRKLGLELNLGLGYTETNPFEQTAGTVRLVGVARERPALSLCLAGGYSVVAAVYACGRTGILDLHDTQAWDSTAVSTSNSYAGSGSIFQLGGFLGIAVGHEPVLFTAQVSQMWRQFDAVTWKGEAQKTLPLDLPRSLDLSSFGYSVGVSIQVKNPD